MKILKLVSSLLCSFALAACSGGHDFEGEYKVDGLAAAIGEKISIGPDYTETNGQRQMFEEIFVRESDGTEYLVFKKADASEQAWLIVDENTLSRGSNITETKLIRLSGADQGDESAATESSQPEQSAAGVAGQVFVAKKNDVETRFTFGNNEVQGYDSQRGDEGTVAYEVDGETIRIDGGLELVITSSGDLKAPDGTIFKKVD
jgi:hypothetical protein